MNKIIAISGLLLMLIFPSIFHSRKKTSLFEKTKDKHIVIDRILRVDDGTRLC